MSLSIQLVFFAIYAIIFLTRKKAGAFISIVATVVAVFAHLKLGISPALPASLFALYAALILGATALYVSSSPDLFADFTSPIRKIVLNPGRRPILLGLLVILPLLGGWQSWVANQPDSGAPAAFRVVHPAPPDSISANGKTVGKKTGNPFRHLEKDDPAAFAEAVLEGRRVYYQNCYFCHGDELAGLGHYAKALNPRPLAFDSKTSIPMFTEAFLFWRIAKGGPGLPDAATPWDSAMPIWENYLTNDEMWQVILYLYDRTGSTPRAQGEH